MSVRDPDEDPRPRLVVEATGPVKFEGNEAAEDQIAGMMGADDPSAFVVSPDGELTMRFEPDTSEQALDIFLDRFESRIADVAILEKEGFADRPEDSAVERINEMKRQRRNQGLFEQIFGGSR